MQFRRASAELLTGIVCALLFSVRLFLGPIRCRYPLGCTRFTVKRLQTTPLGHALWASMRRVVSCASWQPLQKDLFE